MTDMAHEPAPVIGIIDGARYEIALRHFQAQHDELLAALVLAGLCGLRRTEIHTQAWEDVNLERKHLLVPSVTRGTPAGATLRCRRGLAQSNQRPKKGNMCPMIDGPRGRQPSLAIDGIRRIVKDAELFPGWELPKNCFRHSYISHRVAATGDIPRTSMDAGNSADEINRHYRELVMPDEGKRFFEILPRRKRSAPVVNPPQQTGGSPSPSNSDAQASR